MLANLANAAWASATTGKWDTQLFAALAKAVEQRVSDFNMQELTNTARAFAAAGQLDALVLISKIFSNADRQLGSAKWAVSIVWIDITNAPIEMSQ